jgi:hypothetical protein
VIRVWLLGWTLLAENTYVTAYIDKVKKIWGLPANHQADMPECRDSKPKFADKTFAVVLVKVVDAN